MEKLSGVPPNYPNFFRQFVKPMKSSHLVAMANFRTTREKTEGFLPLQQYIADELEEQKVELVVEGVYAPSAEDEDRYLSEPEQVQKLLFSFMTIRLFISCGSYSGGRGRDPNAGLRRLPVRPAALPSR